MKRFLLLIIIFFSYSKNAYVQETVSTTEKTEIIFWHSMAGQLGQEMQTLVNSFNASQPKYKIKPFYKGEYLESLTSYAAAFRARKAPDIIQIFEVGTPTMLAPKGIIKPVEDLMKEHNLPLSLNDFFPVVRAFYSDNGKLMAMPLNISIPVVFYNKEALKKVGYNEKTFPKTWQELETLAAKLREAGYPCAYTSAYPAWVLMESFSAIHGMPMLDKESHEAIYNNAMMVRHFQRLKQWQKLHYFEYSGRTDEATSLFTSGRCPLFSQSSGAYNSLTEMVPFNIGMAPLPLDLESSKERYANVIGGAALWVTNGLSAKKYQGIAQFIAFLAKPDTQIKWHQQTGYIPLGIKNSYQACLTHSKPSLLLAQNELNYPKDASLGIQNQIRVINSEALEAIFADIKGVSQALNGAVLRSNYALQRFRENNAIN
ncbi:glycerol-3-phosphate-binding periplasmic protein precursor (plasmid) [Legionella adelaidensis]|uniref:sn-glycerol-3-phosphate-binding periplasmic protein UgpB n=1 Tax=Legionella adelaidensis TaxID=45056 RepID=A0A0W0R4Y0_9GAMM|nr:extracellular solute-binding protein [Legionella adelaidensis]KTC66145.1 glycerol-3-phosphate-binding periplasmic protein precursor [Legionella adelaidensis]VEH85657.1 glycerol-3-phosphate-binding periplasmic protein precursor [Legionella adelaidensis]